MLKRLIALLLLIAAPAWPCSSGSTCTFWFFDVAVGSYGKLDEGSAPTAANTATKNTVTLSTNQFAEDPITYNSNSLMTDGDNNGPSTPSGANGMRSLNTLNGSFAAGVWTVTFAGICGTAAGNVATWVAHLYKGSNATGAGATSISSDLTSGNFTCNNSSNSLSVSPSLSALTFSNEYLFVTVALEIQGTAIVSDSFTLRVGTSAVATTTFTAAPATTTTQSILNVIN